MSTENDPSSGGCKQEVINLLTADGNNRLDNRRMTDTTMYSEKGSLYPKGMIVDEKDARQLAEKKLYTELLCDRNHIHDYITVTNTAPTKGEGFFRTFFTKLFFNVQSAVGLGGPKMRKRAKSIVFDQWHACARWVKFLEILESEGKRWSRPHVTTLCPYYIQLLRDNLEICDDLSNFKRTAKPCSEDEIYQAIYLSYEGDEDLPVSIRLDPKELKWVIENGLPHDRFEVGRAIGGVFSCEEYKLTVGDTNLDNIKKVIDSFLHHSTLVPFNSWDPRFRMMPPAMEDEVPKWLDPNMRKDKEKDHNEVGGGLMVDIKFKLKHYKSDWLDGFNIQCLSSIIFCYFVNITPIITFGAMTQDDTEGNIGAIESIVGASICGITWALTSGQPLLIISQTGPMLVFDRILYNMVKNFEGMDYLLFRTYVGLWTCLFCIIIVVTKTSKLVKFITNFTEECFACLISLIFIIDGFKKIMSSVDIKQRPDCEMLPDMSYVDPSAATHGNDTGFGYTPVLFSNLNDNATCTDMLNLADNKLLRRPLNESDLNPVSCQMYEACKHEAGYFGMLLSLMTLFFCFLFKNFRTSSLFTTGIRKQLANFGVVISIGICMWVDHKVGLPTYKLHVPSTFRTTLGRPWLVQNFNIHPKWFAMAILPSLLCTVLVFLDQQISAVIINRPENKLKKGDGYHLDLLIIGLLIPVCTFLGFPLYVAATVRSITHVQSLKMFEDTGVPGQAPRFEGVIEQRLTGLVIFILVGLSVAASKYLVHIPLNILYGVFVYMGINALIDLGIVERALLLVTPVKHQPDVPYLRKVKLKAVHVYTIIQLICLIALYIVKSTPSTAIGFPLMIVAIVIVRKMLEFVFSKEELKALDH